MNYSKFENKNKDKFFRFASGNISTESMKILLVGEYSRLHNSLKEGLQALGHQVTLISTGDDFKKFDSDILLNKKYNAGVSKKIKVGIYKLTGNDITSISVKRQFFKHAAQLQGYDVVQLINESPFALLPEYEKAMIDYLRKANKKLFLLSCGADHSSIKFAYERKIRYSILQPFLEGRVSEKAMAGDLKYLTPPFVSLHQFVFDKIDGVIASDMDYHLSLLHHQKYKGLIPNPVNTDKLPYIPMDTRNKIKIFHGINRGNYYRKGNDFFEAALDIIRKKYKNRIEIITAENLPYDTYIEKYNAAHILLDQVYSFDQGYNALEAMAKGKVVFTGAESEFLDFYNLDVNQVCINAVADVQRLVSQLEMLIENPKKIHHISKNARAFVEREHHYLKIAQKYLDVWVRKDSLSKHN